MDPVRVDDTYYVVNGFCHRCRRESLRFSRWGKKGITVEMECTTRGCKNKEWRRVVKRAGARSG